MNLAREVIDDLSSDGPSGGPSGGPPAGAGAGWLLISDRVMGGVSSGSVRHEVTSGRPAIRLCGEVSLGNGGGFLQMALDLGPDGTPVDASAWTGVQLDVIGNGQTYGVHLRTTDLVRPWESYRQGFAAPDRWTRVHLPFAGFDPHRTDRPFRPSRLRRIGLVAIGRAFAVDVALADLRFYRAATE